MDAVAPAAAAADGDAFLCCPIPNSSGVAGVVAGDRLERLRDLSLKNLNLTILCLMYIGVNVVCLIVNSMDGPAREDLGLALHLLEFWGTFVYSIVQVYSLVFSPRSLGDVCGNPRVLKVVVFCNVVATFVSALLVSVSLEMFEGVAHFLEYTNEITMAFVDAVLLAVVARQVGLRLDGAGLTLLTAVFALVVAAIQLSIYSLLDGPNGGPGERVAHFFEFSFEILSAFITFSFCMDNKVACDREIRQLLSSQQAGSLLQANRVWLCVGLVQGQAEAAAQGSRLV